MYCSTKIKGLKEIKQHFSKIILVVLLASILIIFIQSVISKEDTNSNQFLEIKDGQFILNNEPFVMKGFNYYPRNYGWSSMTEWNWNEVDAELDSGASLGANILRTFIDYPYSVGDKDVISIDEIANCLPTEKYLAALDTFLTIAKTHNLKVIFTLFDSMPDTAFTTQFDIYGWAAKVYLDSLILKFINDDRIASWDILNDGDRLPDDTTKDIKFDEVIRFYENMSEKIRSIDSNHLITAGFSKIDKAYLSQNLVDYISCHYYEDQGAFGEKIRKLKDSLKMEIPIVIDEFGFPSKDDAGDKTSEHIVKMVSYLDDILNVYKLNGGIFWILTDFNHPPNTNLTRMPSPFPNNRIHELYRGVYDGNLKPKPSALPVKRYFTNKYVLWDRLDFKYSKIRKGIDLDSLDKRHFAVAFHDKIKFLDKDSLTIDFFTFSDKITNQIQGRGWYKLEDWTDYWGQWAGNLDSISSMYITPPDTTQYIKLYLDADSSNTKMTISMSGYPLDTITVKKDTIDSFVIIFNRPPKIIISNLTFGKDTTFNLNNCVEDINDPPESMKWEVSSSNDSLRIIKEDSNISFEAKNWKGITEVIFKVTDPHGAFDIDTIQVIVTSIKPIKNSTIPTAFFLSPNYPNPFNPITTIRFGIPKTSEVTIKIYNLKGQTIEVIFEGKTIPGYYLINWNAKDHPSGLYFIKFQAGDFVQTEKCMLIK